jgi:hypothetical protein
MPSPSVSVVVSVPLLLAPPAPPPPRAPPAAAEAPPAAPPAALAPSGLEPSWPPGPAAKNAFNSLAWSLVSVPSFTCWSIRLSTRAFICLGSSVPPVWLLSPDCSELSILSSAVSIALASVWLSTPALTAAVISSSRRLRGDGRWVMEAVVRAKSWTSAGFPMDTLPVYMPSAPIALPRA